MHNGDSHQDPKALTGHAYLRQLEGERDEQVPLGDFDAVFRRYAAYVSTIVYRTLGSRQGVEDLVQDVFIDAFRNIKQLQEPAAIKRWLAVIAVRRVYRHLRLKKLRSVFVPGEPPESKDSVAPGATPEERALLSQVFSGLEALPIKQRVAWSLRHVEGMTLQEISHACECSMSTTKRRLARADRRLQEVMGS